MLVMLVMYIITCVSHCTSNNILVFQDLLQVALAQSVKGFISGSKQSILARLVQLVHQTRCQYCSLVNETG